MDAVSQTIMYFQKGGLVMWPLLICSIIVIAISVERFIYYKGADSGAEFAREYTTAAATDAQRAASLIERRSGECARILKAAAEINGGKEAKQAFMEGQAAIFIARLRANLDYLSIIVTMSPLLGLLGTIVGMIGTFSIFNVKEGAPMVITGGIGEALIATASGLCVAILSLICHSYFSHRMDNIITDMEQSFSAYLGAVTRGDA